MTGSQKKMSAFSHRPSAFRENNVMAAGEKLMAQS